MPLPKAPNKLADHINYSSTDIALMPTVKRKATPNSQPPPAPAEPPGAAIVPPRLVTAPVSPANRLPQDRSAPATATVQAMRQSTVPTAKPKRGRSSDVKKLFVLDTNVLMHDPASLFRFAEHDIFLPMVTLEELDHNKKGLSEVSRNARQASRWLDGIAAQSDVEGARPIEQGLALDVLGNTDARGRLFFQTKPLIAPADLDLPMGKADNQIIAVVYALQKQFGEQQVVLVSKDINMRVKARALGIPTEDYHNDQVIDDAQLLYSGSLALPEDFWDKHAKDIESWQQQSATFYKFSGPLVGSLQINQFVHLDGALPLQAQVKEITGKHAVLQTLRDYTHTKNAVWGITARNREQNFALNLLMNQDIDFVTLLGQAGTGKTLLALAAALVQTIEARRFTEIIVTRATVPVGEDIGYLPGTEEEKMQPWMGALEDNLEVLMQGQGGTGAGGEWGRAATQDLIKARIRVKAMSFMRGRTFINKFLIIDEAQNLTPKQMKTLITRAGPGTKVVCMGNIAQIDTPYLTESSSGLTYSVDRFRGWAHAGHIVLQRGERSRLADYAAEAL
jgi:PhoH-like ATPase